MQVVFCSDPLETRKVDESFSDQAEAVTSLGGQFELIHLEALTNDGSAAQAVRRVRTAEPPVTAIYRGWMLTPSQYADLYVALAERGVRLINDPVAYRHCHWLPECYADIADLTPRSIWFPKDDGLGIDKIMAGLKAFGTKPLILKDYVKSQKHYWREACFIPDASDQVVVERVVARFLELQDEDLAGGLVFREYIDLAPLAIHSKSGMPLAQEYRVFVLDGRPMFVCNYWEEGEYKVERPDLSQFAEVMKKAPARPTVAGSSSNWATARYPGCRRPTHCSSTRRCLPRCAARISHE